VESLDDETAAETLEEMAAERQAQIIGDMDEERAADILEHMSPDEAADVLGDLPEAKAEVCSTAWRMTSNSTWPNCCLTPMTPPADS